MNKHENHNISSITDILNKLRDGCSIYPIDICNIFGGSASCQEEFTSADEAALDVLNFFCRIPYVSYDLPRQFLRGILSIQEFLNARYPSNLTEVKIYSQSRASSRGKIVVSEVLFFPSRLDVLKASFRLIEKLNKDPKANPCISDLKHITRVVECFENEQDGSIRIFWLD